MKQYELISAIYVVIGKLSAYPGQVILLFWNLTTHIAISFLR